MSNIKYLALSGQMFTGKDFVAQAGRYKIVGFADPIYELTEHLCGSRDKSVPGVRECMQKIGQWGWGHVSHGYPCSMDRAAVTWIVQNHGAQITRDFRWADWRGYGNRRDMWVNILLLRLGLASREEQEALHQVALGNGWLNIHSGNYGAPDSLKWLYPRTEAEQQEAEGAKFAIVNVRFDHEDAPLRNSKFERFHVMCSEETRRERMEKAGYLFVESTDNDLSEQMAKRLNVDMPDSRVIWNDHRPMPAGRKYLTVAEFMDLAGGDQVRGAAGPVMPPEPSK